MSDAFEVVGEVRAELGEGPLWDVERQRIVWVDIVGRAIHDTDPVSGATDTITTPSAVGTVVARRDGGMLAALADGIWAVDDGELRPFARADHDTAELRFNDGKCDPAGRFWAGTMALDEERPIAALHRIDTDGTMTTTLTGVTISNGLAWSRDASTLFYIDSATGRIDAFDVDLDAGSLDGRRTVVDVEGTPDGMTIDADDALWVALFGGGAVHRYVDGRLDRVIRLPVSNVTSCTFGGGRLTDLYITTARHGLSDEQRRAEPLAGALFRVPDAGAGTVADRFGTEGDRFGPVADRFGPVADR